VGGESEGRLDASSFAHEEQPAVVDPTRSAAAMHLEIFTLLLRISRTTNPVRMTLESRGDNLLTMSVCLVLHQQITKKDEALRRV